MKTIILIFMIFMIVSGEEKGNINLLNRPIVYNQDGTISTILSTSFNIDGKEVLLPWYQITGLY